MAKRAKTQLPAPGTEIEGEIISLIGRLMVQWSNLESWFVALLAKLLRVDTHRAEIVFYTISTAISRRALLSRVFMTYVADESFRDRFSELLDRFKSVTETRNKFAHSQYQFSPSSQYMTTTKFRSDFEGDTWVQHSSLDKNLRNEVKQGILNCINTQDDLFELLKNIEPVISDKPIKLLHQHANIP